MAEVVRPRLASLFEPPRAASGLVAESGFDRERSTLGSSSDAAACEAPSVTIQAETRILQSRTAMPLVPLRETRLEAAVLRARPGIQMPRAEDATPKPAADGTTQWEPATGKSAPRQQGASGSVSTPLKQPLVLLPSDTDEVQPSTEWPTARSIAPVRVDRMRQTFSSPPGDGPNSAPEPTKGLAVREQVTALQETKSSSLKSLPDAPAEVRESSRREPVLVRAVPTSAPSQLSVQPRFPPRLEPARRPASQEAEPEPAIHVTIGRVEVRATAPPSSTTSSKNRSAPGAMNLDEYLRRRA